MAHYAFSFGLKWRVTGREDGRTLGTGTLKYADVASPADGEGAPVIGDVDETTDASDGQVDPATPPGRVEANASRLAAAPGLLKAAVETTLSEFSDALEVHAPKTSGAGGGTDGADSADGAAPAAEPEGPPPITFEQYKSNKEKAEKEAKEAQEAKEKAAKDAADAERRRTRKEEKLRADDADLAGMRGYKVRADGSKTSYFTREVDEQTKALLDAQKAPKRLSVGAAPDAAAPSAASAGSAWNTGGTWEEKDMTSWAKEELEKRLKTVKAVDGALSAKVSKVKDVEGSASVVASRGTTRHLYDFSFELEYKVSSEGEGGEGEEEVKPTTVCRGSLSYSEVACSKTTGTVQVGDVANQFKSDPTAEQKPAALGAIGTLKGQVHAVLAQFDADYRASKKI